MKNFYFLISAFVFSFGILLASLSVFANLPPVFLSAAVILFFILLILLRKNGILFITFFLVLVFLLGAVRYNIFNRIPESNVKNYISTLQGAVVLVQGTVAGDPWKSRGGKKTAFTLEAAAIKKDGDLHDASGFILVNSYNRSADTFRYGDIVVLEGVLREPFSYSGNLRNFDYKKYLGNKRIYCALNAKKASLVKKVGEDKSIVTGIVRYIYGIREKLIGHIENYLNLPESAMLGAILLGERREIPPGLRDLFARTGTLHILAISGLHVGIMYFALKVILQILRVPGGISVLLSVLILACFAVLTGARPPILRAAIMFSILAFTGILRRKTGVFNLMGLSCLIILLINPNQVFDTGFILSYMAVLSIAAISPLFYRMFYVKVALRETDRMGKKIRYYLLRPVSVSLAACAGLSPLIAYYFGLFSPIVVVANLAVVPLLFFVMASGILFATFGLLSKPLAIIFSQSAWAFLALLVKSVEFLEKVPFAYFEVQSPPLYMILSYYMAIVSAVVIMNTLPRSPQ